jgi:hypothetical protein
VDAYSVVFVEDVHPADPAEELLQPVRQDFLLMTESTVRGSVPRTARIPSGGAVKLRVELTVYSA